MGPFILLIFYVRYLSPSVVYINAPLVKITSKDGKVVVSDSDLWVGRWGGGHGSNVNQTRKLVFYGYVCYVVRHVSDPPMPSLCGHELGPAVGSLHPVYRGTASVP